MTIFRKRFFAPQAKLDGTHYSRKRIIIDVAASWPCCEARSMEELLRMSVPPDPDLVDLIIGVPGGADRWEEG